MVSISPGSRAGGERYTVELVSPEEIIFLPLTEAAGPVVGRLSTGLPWVGQGNVVILRISPRMTEILTHRKIC
jgi:hypothetical protein